MYGLFSPLFQPDKLQELSTSVPTKKHCTGGSVSWHSSIDNKQALFNKSDHKKAHNVSYSFTNCTFNFYGTEENKGGIEGAIRKVAERFQPQETKTTQVLKKHVKPVEEINFNEISDADMMNISQRAFTLETPKPPKKL